MCWGERGEGRGFVVVAGLEGWMYILPGVGGLISTDIFTGGLCAV